MLKDYIISTNHQRVLSFLSKFADSELHEREIARRIGISYGSANQTLNDLHSAGALERRREGKMCFYRLNLRNPIVQEFKRLNILLLLEPLVQKIKKTVRKIVLFGSCAQGTDTTESDVDLFIVAQDREKVLKVVNSYSPGSRFQQIKIQPVVKTPLELLEMENKSDVFLTQVRKGIVLWEKVVDESKL